MNENVTSKTLEKILHSFPEINKEWLLTGEGEMKRSGTIHQTGRSSTAIIGSGVHVNSTTSIDKAMDRIAEQQKLTKKALTQIDRLISIIENNLTKK
ncbi:MAG: hypothetical protein NC048_00175 [Bacteroides sp.]|nr:hypothetical protein [Ruminococcus flavefaciens]MCM1553901.1 hypothetical protein [Bacteroides sp.]